MPRDGFKAIIAGGSVTGLTLANIFERLDIDYVVLEAYPEIAPQKGASIGLWPNGLRVLDQLGCYDEFAQGVDFLNDLNLRLKGKSVGFFQGTSSHMRARHGYEVVFHDRQRLLQVLYENLKNKDKILLKKRVIDVAATSSGVSIQTQDGDTFAGDILVGADGIHSTVRKEMWRIADEISPGFFPEDELKRVPIAYRALFGISKPQKSLPPTLVNPVWNKGWSNLIFGGPGGRVYWFLFERLEKTFYGDNVPKYTKEDEKELVEKHRDDAITEDVTLGDLYDNSVSVGMTPLHEWMFKQWHFERMITLGDAAHKINPITGQGGNNAIEDAAALANALVSKLDESSERLNVEQIDYAFGQVQNLRQERSQQAVDIAKDVQNVEAMQMPGASLMVKIMLPLLTKDMRLERQSGVIVDAVRVDNLAMPYREHFVPYADELPANPIRKAWFSKAVVVASFAALLYLSNAIPSDSALPSSIRGGNSTASFFGVPPIDRRLSANVKSLSLAIANPGSAESFQAQYFIASLLPTLLIWLIEAYRRGNTQTIPGKLMTWPTIDLAASAIFGIAKIAPIYFTLQLLTSSNPIYQRTSGRIVDPAIAKAALPALFLGFVIPSILMLIPSSTGVSQTKIALWKLAPISVAPLASGIARIIRGREGPQEPDPHQLKMFENRDLPWLQASYATVFAVSAGVHIYIMASVLSAPALSIFGVFVKNIAFDYLKCNLAVHAACLTMWYLYGIFEMRVNGYVTTGKAWMATVAALASTVAVGPAATYAGVWFWRERTIAGLSK